MASSLPAPRSSLVIQTSFLGDVVLTTPLIAHLAGSGPVDVVVTPGGAELLLNNPHIRRTIVYDKHGAHRGLRAFHQIAHEITAADATATAYCAQGSLRTAFLALVAGYSRRTGFDTSAGRRFYTQQVRYRADRHHAERLLRLAVGDADSVPASAIVPRLYPGAREEDAVDALLGRARVGGAQLIAIAPGSVWATKRWPYYAELAHRLAALGRVVIVGSAADSDLAADIARDAGAAVVDATGHLSLLASAALIARCALLVTNDSAPQHLAAAVGAPTLTIFGPTVPEFGFGPLGPGSATAGAAGLACRPCHPHGPAECPLGHWRCMRELNVDQVFDAAVSVLNATAA